MGDQPTLPFNDRCRPTPQGDYSPGCSGPFLDTRAESIITHEAEGKVDSQARRILRALVSQGPMTRNELEKYFQDDEPMIRLSSICGRVRELMKAEEIEVDGEREDEITGRKGEVLKAVHDYIITDEKTVIS